MQLGSSSWTSPLLWIWGREWLSTGSSFPKAPGWLFTVSPVPQLSGKARRRQAQGGTEKVPSSGPSGIGCMARGQRVGIQSRGRRG